MGEVQPWPRLMQLLLEEEDMISDITVVGNDEGCLCTVTPSLGKSAIYAEPGFHLTTSHG